jgi:capsular exopolysaccharide synthesis family protein
VGDRVAESEPESVDAFPSESSRRPVPTRPAPVQGNVAPAAPTGPQAVPYLVTRLADEVEGKVVVDSETSAASIEEYRRLATSLHLLQTQSGIRTLMVSSALAKDGKTLTSTNLALTLSESYKRRVLLIDADLRRPSVHHVFRVRNGTGLADSLRSGGTVPLPLIEVSEHLTVLPAGPADASPMAGLTSDTMRAIVADARRQFDWVIIDTPPVALISDASLLASLVDGVILVIGAGSTPYPAVKRAVDQFGVDRIVGAVLNRVADRRSTYNYYGEDRYGTKDGTA